jgi:hypothetical protein
MTNFLSDALDSFLKFLDEAYKEGWMLYALIGIIGIVAYGIIKG